MIKILIENKINQLVEEFFEEYDGGGNLLVIDDEEDIDVDELFMDIEPHESISSIYREDDRIFIEINEYDLNNSLREKIKGWNLDRDEEERYFQQSRFSSRIASASASSLVIMPSFTGARVILFFIVRWGNRLKC